MTVTPMKEIISAVPRSGCRMIRPAGTPISAAGRPDRAPAPDVAGRQQLVEAREDQHDRRLHELARLQADEAEVEPALGALADEADSFDERSAGQARRHRSGRRPA